VRRFQTSGKIITALFAAMRFDGRVKRRGEQLERLPACAGGGLGGLIQEVNQPGAGL
jgi:hypothetical protein